MQTDSINKLLLGIIVGIVMFTISKNVYLYIHKNDEDE